MTKNEPSATVATSLIHHLLENYQWLAGKGGCPSRGARSVVLVVRPGETSEESSSLLVDPQGYNYARYVGFYCTDTVPRAVTRLPGLPTLAEAMPTLLCGVSMKDRIFAECERDRLTVLAQSSAGLVAG